VQWPSLRHSESSISVSVSSGSSRT
jgi:hypothetical protein